MTYLTYIAMNMILILILIQQVFSQNKSDNINDSNIYYGYGDNCDNIQQCLNDNQVQNELDGEITCYNQKFCSMICESGNDCQDKYFNACNSDKVCDFICTSTHQCMNGYICYEFECKKLGQDGELEENQQDKHYIQDDDSEGGSIGEKEQIQEGNDSLELNSQNAVDLNKENNKVQIPCAHLKYYHLANQKKFQSEKYLIYFHGNAEDIGYAKDFYSAIRDSLQVNLIAVEYPGYGVYKNINCTAQQIKYDAQQVYNFIKNQLKIEEKNIIVFGRSIGSGPACHLAGSNPNLGALILMSAYTSICDVANNIFCFVGYLIPERFNNKKEIQKIKCPLLLIHGKKDEVIKFTHAQDLVKASENNLRPQNRLMTVFPENMTHNEFDLEMDILDNLVKFFEQNQIQNYENINIYIDK
ncbi:hypothetical protein PPERSA_08134 [Pseudocohnilembus persalinus]|uniref:Phospholipase/carboxylesterase/thioesterase domain-containing protein n=1 Tax=Pseudocohnilembus persalinus TaxID=266149 RepID=A0A0V0QL53_PSEPJ|nr:hypothetical protein PPERSA_08134 [Pseudocohnilembus persalinus]|eukprot:KRX03059.1 hypothetical protein PPERSA_08134 [Pseudocohnilembus persalinus]